jgi:hypothetical protein
MEDEAVALEGASPSSSLTKCKPEQEDASVNININMRHHQNWESDSTDTTTNTSFFNTSERAGSGSCQTIMTKQNIPTATDAGSRHLDPSLVDAADILAAITRNIMSYGGGGEIESKYHNQTQTMKGTQPQDHSRARSKSSDEIFSMQDPSSSPLELLCTAGNQVMHRSFSSPKLTLDDNTMGGSHMPLRRGKWTHEEESYVARIILYFNQGLLPSSTGAKAGMTLRSYLSEQLHCDPMRITKKFTGEACIGKRVYQPITSITLALAIPTDTKRQQAQAELYQLRCVWLDRMVRQDRSHPTSTSLMRGERAANAQQTVPGVPSKITRVAIWLDKAGQILSKTMKHEHYCDDCCLTVSSVPATAELDIETNNNNNTSLTVGGPSVEEHRHQVLEELRQLQILLHEAKDVVPLMTITNLTRVRSKRRSRLSDY